MVVQNNNSHWVILAVIVLCLAVTFGAILTGALGPSQDVKDERERIINQATQAALNAIQTQEALRVDQTAVSAHLTARPPAQTATALVLSENHAVIQQAATQTAIANSQYIGNLSVAATAAVIAEDQRRQAATTNISISVVIAGVVLFCVWMLSRAAVNMLNADTQRSIAQAQALEHQRQLAEFRAAHQKPARPIVQPSIPVSMIKERGNGHKLPRAE